MIVTGSGPKALSASERWKYICSTRGKVRNGVVSESSPSADANGVGNTATAASAGTVAVATANNASAATLVSFRVGPEDAVVLGREFQPKFGVEDLLNLPNHDVYLKLMIDGTPSPPFSAHTERS